MRSSRFIAILVALLFAVVAPMSTAQATTDSGYAKARQPHDLRGVKAFEYGTSGTFYVKGQVLTYRNKYVKLQKKNCKGCAYRPYRKAKTTNTGKFRINFDGPIGSCWRIVVPGTAKYRPAYKPFACIIRG